MNVLVSGLVNVETSVKVRKFPIEYYPIDIHFLEWNHILQVLPTIWQRR